MLPRINIIDSEASWEYNKQLITKKAFDALEKRLRGKGKRKEKTEKTCFRKFLELCCGI